MGNCCSQPDKPISIEPEQQSYNENTQQVNLTSKLYSKGDIINHQSDVYVETKREDSYQFDSQYENTQPLYNSGHKQANPNSTVNIQSNPNIQASVIQSSPITQTQNVGQVKNNSGFNQNNHSLQESNSLNGHQHTKQGTIIKHSQADEVTSQKGNHTQETSEKDHKSLVDRGAVQQIQYINSDTQKFLFLCRNDQSKSFILQLPPVQAQQQDSIHNLFDIAQKYVKQQYGTDAISLELLFGMQNMQKSLQYHQDCFPAYFKTKEIFEESYYIQVQLPQSAKTQGNSTWIQQIVFPSMTIDDAKKELCKIDPNLISHSCSMYKIMGEDQVNVNGNTNTNNWIPLLDEEKFGLHSHGMMFVIRNIDDDKPLNMNGSTQNQNGASNAHNNEVYWPISGDNSSIQEVQLQKKGEAHRRVMVGINIEHECKNSSCKFNGKKQVKSIGLGMFDLVENQKISCSQCKSNQNTQIHQIGFFQCRFAFTGIQDFKKKQSPKWFISFSALNMKKLDQREVMKKQNHSHQIWNYFIENSQWTKFKIFSKRFANCNKQLENEEFLHSLQLEDISSNKMCGVCKQNVGDQMQHTLDCGHAFHKICLNLLPQLFSTIRCPLCVKLIIYYFIYNQNYAIILSLKVWFIFLQWHQDDLINIIFEL